MAFCASFIRIGIWAYRTTDNRVAATPIGSAFIASRGTAIANTSSPILESPSAPRAPYSALARACAHPDFAASTTRTYPAGTTILKEGETSGNIYLVARGKVRVEGTVRLPSGRQFQAGVGDLETGAIFGELALFDREPHSATVIAATSVEIIEINGAALLRFLDRNRDLGYEVLCDLIQQLAPRLRKTTARVYRFLAWGLKAYHLDD
ncbi:MAG: Crp/Fnr family transcriptional regulator [Gammaproteobacteria bacterium]